MLSVYFSTMQRFRREERGVVLILVVVLIVPLLLVIAIGLDFGQSLVVKRQLSSAVDAAALAIGTDPDITDQSDLDTKAQEYIQAHYSASDIGTLTGFNVVRTVTADQDIEISVSASADIPTIFMSIGGVNTLTVSVSSKVIRRERDLEIALVLDNSGSMGGSKIAALKSAATLLVNILMGDQDTSDDVRIALVPFTGSVNVGVPATTAWLDRNNPAPIEDYLDLAANQSIFNVLETMAGGIDANWRGCVRSRGNGHDMLDTTPSTQDPSTLFSAYFMPHLTYYSHISDPDYYNGISSDQQNSRCVQTPIQPLTNTRSTILTAINAMQANFNTNVAEGLAWGWRVLSPNEPFTEAVPYTEQRTLKIIIVLTDGANSVDGSTRFSSYGFGTSDNPQLGPYVNSTLNSKTAEICNNIKANHDTIPNDDDIVVFSIVFDVSSTTIIDLMEACATETDNFFNSPSESDLEAAFRSIATGLNQLRIAQ